MSLDLLNALLHEWACAVLSENRERANAAYCELRMHMERCREPSWGNGRPSRAQFLRYSPVTGQIS